MNMNQSFDPVTRAGIAGGTLLTVFFNIHRSDILKTAILAAVGAIVSFGVSFLLKWLLKKNKRL